MACPPALDEAVKKPICASVRCGTTEEQRHHLLAAVELISRTKLNVAKRNEVGPFRTTFGIVSLNK